MDIDPKALAGAVAAGTVTSVEGALDTLSRNAATQADKLEVFFRTLIEALGGAAEVEAHADRLRSVLGSWYGPLFLTQLSLERPGDGTDVPKHVERRLQAVARELVLWDTGVILVNVVIASRNKDTVAATYCTAMREGPGFTQRRLEEFNARLGSYVSAYGTTARRPLNLLRPRSHRRSDDLGAALTPLASKVLVSDCVSIASVDREGDPGAFEATVLAPLGLKDTAQMEVTAGADTFFANSSTNLGAVAIAYVFHTTARQPDASFVRLAEHLLMQVATVSALAEAERRGRDIERTAAAAREEATRDLAGWLSHEGIHYAAWLRDLAGDAATLSATASDRERLSTRISAIADMVAFTTRLTEFTLDGLEARPTSIDEFRTRLESAWEVIRDDGNGSLRLSADSGIATIPAHVLAFAIELVRNGWRHRMDTGAFDVVVTVRRGAYGVALAVDSGPHRPNDIDTLLRIAAGESKARGRSRGWHLLLRWSAELRVDIIARRVSESRVCVECAPRLR